MRWIKKIPWYLLIAGTLTLGLAPFSPEPHLVEKIRLLFNGALTRPVDIFDLILHGSFPALLILRLIASLVSRRNSPA